MYWSQMESPIGTLTLIASTKGLCYLSFSSEISSLPWLKGSEVTEDPGKTLPYMEQVAEYLEGKRKKFNIPLDIRFGTTFQQKVWNELLTIPYGEVRSYKDIAIAIQHPKAVRAVGNANNKNPLPIVIPCHRVIGSNGKLIGYGGGLCIKGQLLTIEGFQDIAI